jgi:gas vesicle protein
MNNENEYNRVGCCGKAIGDIFIIAVTAAAAGLVAGLLFAPRSGLKTRKMLNTVIKEMIDKSKFAMLEARVMSEELLEKSMERAEKVSSNIRGKK